MSDPLPATEAGVGAGAEAGSPLVLLLHGFGGSRAQWEPLQRRLAEAEARSVALDLPGHGDALGGSYGLSTIDARNAVVAEIERRGKTVHLVGHSRGGAIAALVAMKAPERVASLTLLAPGGFGPEIAEAELRAHASARTADEVRAALLPLYHPARPSRRAVAAQVAWRERPDAVPTLERIAETLSENGVQGQLDLRRLANAPFPVTVVWGERDAVLPASQAHAAPGADTRILPGLGHMLMDEAPDAIAAIIAEQLRAGHT